MTSPESAEHPAATRVPRRRPGRLFWGILLLLLFVSIGIVWLTSPELFAWGLFNLGKRDDDPPKVIFQLRYEPPRLLGRPANPNAQAEAEVFRQSQAAIVKMQHLIERALEEESMPGASRLISTAPDQANVVKWIQDRLRVDFPAHDLMALTLPGVPRTDAVRILNSLAKQYLEQVVDVERTVALERVSQLEKNYRELESEVRQKRNELKKTGERIGTTSGERLQSAYLAAFETALVNLNRVRFDLVQKEVQLAHRQELATDDTPVSDDEIALDIERDATLAALSTRRMILQTLLSEPQADSPAKLPPERSLWEQELNTLTKLEAVRRETLHQSIADRLKGAIVRQRNSEVKKLQEEVVLLTSTYNRLQEESILREKRLNEANVSSIEIEMMQANLAILEDIKDEVARAYQRERIELQETSRDQSALSSSPSSRVRMMAPAR